MGGSTIASLLASLPKYWYTALLPDSTRYLAVYGMKASTNLRTCHESLLAAPSSHVVFHAGGGKRGITISSTDHVTAHTKEDHSFSLFKKVSHLSQ